MAYDPLHFEPDYDVLSRSMEHHMGWFELISPGCTFNGREYDIYFEQLMNRAAIGFEDVYSGHEDTVEFIVFLYLKYGILNVQHWLCLHRLIIMFRNMDRLLEFISILVEVEIELLNQLLQQHQEPDVRQLYSNIKRFLQQRLGELEPLVIALADFSRESGLITREYLNDLGIDENNLHQYTQVLNENRYQIKLQRLWGGIFKNYSPLFNNFRTSGQLIEMCYHSDPENIR